MFRTEQIVHRLYRIESLDGNLYEDRVPSAHRTVPETWKFESLEVAAVLALVGDEARVLIHKLRQIIAIAPVIFRGTDEIDRIEMRAAFEHGLLFRIAHIDL